MTINNLFINFIQCYVFLFCGVDCLKINQSVGDEVTRVVSAIGYKYFSHFDCILLVTETNRKKDISLETLNLPQFTSNFQVSVDEEKMKICQVPLLYGILETAFERACKGFIVHVSNPMCFLETWKHVAKSSLHRYNPRILFLPTAKNKIISPEILNSNVSDFILEMTIVDMHVKQIPGSEIFLKIVTSDWSNSVHTLAECKARECVDYMENLYPEKISNLKSRELKVATFNYAPYALLDNLEGTELRIALEYCHLHNCSVTVVTDEAEWGQIYENGTGNGILGNVAEERADIGLGALYLWYHEYQFLDFSMPYIRTGITCLAPKPELLSTLLLPIRPFTLVTWSSVLCALAVACAALYLTKKLDLLVEDKATDKKKRHCQWFTTKEDTLFRTVGFVVLQASSNYTVETNSIRHLVNWLHVTFLLVATSYSSGLASILTVPSYWPPIDSVSDFVNSGLQWGATHDAWIFSLREATEPPMSTLVDRFRALPKELLYRKSLSADFAFSVERLPAGHFAVGDYITLESMKHLRLMKQDLYYEYCLIVFQKGSPYSKSFNTLIHRLLDSGLLLFWEGEVARKFLRSSIQSSIKESTAMLSRAQLTRIQLGHVQGAFIILGAGLSMAFTVFLVETCVGLNIRNSYKNKSHTKK